MTHSTEEAIGLLSYHLSQQGRLQSQARLLWALPN